jgi:hypothetical protein
MEQRMSSRDTLDSDEIDALYGLEPVIEPGRTDASSPTEFVTVQCPYCGERFDIVIDVSAGSFNYVEDCQVCCQPIELAGSVDASGTLAGVTAARAG